MDKYRETFITWNKLARIYEDRFMDFDLYNDSYDIFLDLIGTNSYVLDIGCGPGNITRYLLTKNPSLNIKGIDNSENMITLARSNNPLAEFVMMDSRNLKNLNDKFDAIICGFCIPYLSKEDCRNLFSDCKNLIGDSGYLYLSFVAGDYENSGFISGISGDRTYFYFYDMDSLVKDLKANSFRLIKSLFKQYRKADGSEEIHTILIAKKG